MWLSKPLLRLIPDAHQLSSVLRSSDVCNVGRRSTVLTHDDEAHANTGPVQGNKATQLAWLHNVRSLTLSLCCSCQGLTRLVQFDFVPVPGTSNSYTIVHSASGRKLVYPAGPQDKGLVTASTSEASQWEMFKDGAADTYM